jgi:hypothetical protein
MMVALVLAVVTYFRAFFVPPHRLGLEAAALRRQLTRVQTHHREVMAAFDFFTVPTLTFRVLYCFFVIEHPRPRRRILRFNITAHPTADSIAPQWQEALRLPCPYRLWSANMAATRRIKHLERWALT